MPDGGSIEFITNKRYKFNGRGNILKLCFLIFFVTVYENDLFDRRERK